MLVGYVSDEQFVALADVLIEFEREGQSIAVARSTPRGSVYAEIEPGKYRVTLAKQGFGPKHVDLEIGGDTPYQFRLLSDRLLGYVWPKWAKSGEKGEFRVHSVEPYRLSLWRYGFKRELVKLLGWFDEHGPRANMQITPDCDYTQTGCCWNQVGYGSPHHTQFADAPERSGLYYFHAETESGTLFSFPWVVAPAAPTARIAVVASTNTWCAYNNFGGRGNYINANRLPEMPFVNARQDAQRYTQAGSFNEWMFPDEEYAPLSFERPEPGNCVHKDEECTDPIRGRTECGMAPAEWRLLAWLEREGYSYDLYSEYHLHSGELDLSAYKVLILGVHPEYWSRNMYARVKTWVFDLGGKLMYMGGNGLNCEVEFLDESTLRFNTQLPTSGGDMAFEDPESGRMLESRFHRRVESEANLLGVVCTDSGIMTAAPYRALSADHWIFKGTGLHDGDIFGEVSLHERCSGGASGHETDKMSASSPPNTILLAKGMNTENGGAEMVFHETESGGAVFSTGSITFAASLLVDPSISQVTGNVLERFLIE